MSEMVVKVGYAIEKLLLSRIYAKRVEGYTIEASREFARAAIEAMREPTEEMADVGRFQLEDCAENPGGCSMTALHCWEAMIDSALSPASGEKVG